jgi:hypothetical protein
MTANKPQGPVTPTNLMCKHGMLRRLCPGDHSDELILVTTHPCPVCGRVRELPLPVAGVTRWQQGAHVQDAFPEIPPALRELLITGTCPGCWAKITKPLDEEDA